MASWNGGRLQPCTPNPSRARARVCSDTHRLRGYCCSRACRRNCSEPEAARVVARGWKTKLERNGGRIPNTGLQLRVSSNAVGLLRRFGLFQIFLHIPFGCMRGRFYSSEAVQHSISQLIHLRVSSIISPFCSLCTCCG